ncbi:hypothetical protein NDU88_007237 [Pleurodeles waltl]|uniref:Uncharacterized protein n=1 Tax=Pleurodeles waltl TaxID=8319 RepID=A0AAV7NAY4_PLEWA|nr:hypothetical protein NDU88_007237 [Pleurodeles waltl]
MGPRAVGAGPGPQKVKAPLRPPRRPRIGLAPSIASQQGGRQLPANTEKKGKGRASQPKQPVWSVLELLQGTAGMARGPLLASGSEGGSPQDETLKAMEVMGAKEVNAFKSMAEVGSQEDINPRGPSPDGRSEMGKPRGCSYFGSPRANRGPWSTYSKSLGPMEEAGGELQEQEVLEERPVGKADDGSPHRRMVKHGPVLAKNAAPSKRSPPQADLVDMIDCLGWIIVFKSMPS